jgi:para-aminobenzoate synthetase component 1
MSDASCESGLPVVEPLDSTDTVAMFLRLKALPHCLFLDSARRHAQLGRYSYLTADPFDFLQLPVSTQDAFPLVGERLAQFTCPAVAGLPAFQGGAAGLLSYDLHQGLENIPRCRFDEFQVPALAIGLYDVVIAVDHVLGQAWIISQGFPEQEPAARHRRARERIDEFRQLLDASPREFYVAPKSGDIPLAELAPQHRTADHGELLSNFSERQYLAAIGQAVEYIHAGDVFQVNLAQRLLHSARDSAVELYLRLRERNPATFAGYFDTGEFEILSASPERFLQVRDRQVEARPIKGTRKRTARPEADLFSGDDLQQSEKDRAENVMIVDLLRNDLSKACTADSVRVTELCRLESYEFVQHLVSVVTGTLRPGVSNIDLLAGAFPGGSITGAPKVRAMEIIAELEPTARGAYCGGLGYLGFDGSMDMNILIRTITAGRGWWQFPVGGGIVAQSKPNQEYAETWHKAEGILRALR